jgi:hypothetical protein
MPSEQDVQAAVVSQTLLFKEMMKKWVHTALIV